MKKVLIILLVFVVMLFAVSCGESETPPTQPGSGNSQIIPGENELPLVPVD